MAGLLGLGAMAVASRWLWPDMPNSAAHGPSFALLPRALLAMGLIAFGVLFCEGAVADWSAVYLRETLGSGPGLAAAGYSAFALLMAIGRLTGDRLTEQLGPLAIVRGGGVLVVLGMAVVLLSGAPLLAIAGFACVGAGVACSFPILLSMAARTPGVAPGTAIAAIATSGYTGFLVGPPLIGVLAERAGLDIAAAGRELAVRNDLDAGRDAVVVELQLRDERPVAVAYREMNDSQLELLAAAIGDAKVAVHRLPVERSLQQRLGGYDRDLH
jgi:fucose permease